MRRAARMVLVAFAAVVLTLSLPAFAEAASTTALSVPASIDASGDSDVSVALDEFFQSVPAGATITFPKDARYRVEGVIWIRSAKNVTIDGNGAEIFADTNGAD
ncbi:MAG TPA: hypothetical protein VNC41_09505, partial [Acidimicrobiia bacterium]|nr:hypothetical protein [Acidimicrobiia bacterium]